MRFFSATMEMVKTGVTRDRLASGRPHFDHPRRRVLETVLLMCPPPAIRHSSLGPRLAPRPSALPSPRARGDSGVAPHWRRPGLVAGGASGGLGAGESVVLPVRARLGGGGGSTPGPSSCCKGWKRCVSVLPLVFGALTLPASPVRPAPVYWLTHHSPNTPPRVRFRPLE